jgi:protein phosphatase
MQDANTRIYCRGQANEEFKGMGTTLSSLVLLPEGALVGHVGDSRIYRLRGDLLEQLTFDHSLVWEVCEAEGISEEEVPAYIPRNVITRSVGSRSEVFIDLEGLFPLELGDTFLLCSDGLSSLVKNKELGIVLGCLPPGRAAQTLVDLAITRGGPDNISALVVRYSRQHSRATEVDGESNTIQTVPAPIGMWLWVLFIAACAGMAGYFAAGYLLAAGAALAGAVLAGGAFAWAEWRAKTPWHRRLDARPLGKGPYTDCECPIDRQASELFGNTVAQLRNLAEGENWQIDWDGFNAFSQHAEAAHESQNYVRAVREHCGAISFLVNEVRAQNAATEDDELLLE